MLKTDLLKYWTIQAVMLCTDLELLDLLWKLLCQEGGVNSETA